MVPGFIQKVPWLMQSVPRFMKRVHASVTGGAKVVPGFIQKVPWLMQSFFRFIQRVPGFMQVLQGMLRRSLVSLTSSGLID